VTTLKNSSENEVKEALKRQLLEEKLSFVNSFAVPHSLQIVDNYESVKNAANGIVLAGDYLEFPSLQGALVSGRKAAEEVLAKS
jgi:predicted NAD/FAD-dependent oxidoreductase